MDPGILIMQLLNDTVLEWHGSPLFSVTNFSAYCINFLEGSMNSAKTLSISKLCLHKEVEGNDNHLLTII